MRLEGKIVRLRCRFEKPILSFPFTTRARYPLVSQMFDYGTYTCDVQNRVSLPFLKKIYP